MAMGKQIRAIALLHPGTMGVTIGAVAAAGGARVLWVSDGRSGATRRRAEEAKLIESPRLTDALNQADTVLSVCPPHAALDVARSVAAEKFRGIYVDANAISRDTAQTIGRIVSTAGASFVDGGIIGAPVRRAQTTRLYLSGDRAAEIAALFEGTLLDARAIGAAPGAASALKVAYAAWTKCTDALALAIRAYATEEGIDEALLEEWAISQPSLANKCDRAAAIAVPKAWRYVGEMREIAEAFASAGLPAGFHLAAAEICERFDRFKDQTDPALSVATVLRALERQKSTEATSETEKINYSP
jgi:3-hydroxyisobutyrate dehydrogenase-like beta-hydroxyacid dehydrogenase